MLSNAQLRDVLVSCAALFFLLQVSLVDIEDGIETRTHAGGCGPVDE